MRLVLTTPSTWQLRTHGEQRLAIVDDDVVIVWGWLVPLPDDRSAWMTRALSVDVESPAIVRIGDVSTRATVTGWPLRLAPATVVRTDGTVAEYRLGAFYAFLEYGAVALVRSRSQIALQAARAQLDDVLASGTPAWHGTPACLHDILCARSSDTPSA